MGQLGGIGVDEGILVLRARDAGADRDVLRRLHVNREAVEACQLRAQAADHLVGATSMEDVILFGQKRVKVPLLQIF